MGTANMRSSFWTKKNTNCCPVRTVVSPVPLTRWRNSQTATGTMFVVRVLVNSHQGEAWVASPKNLRVQCVAITVFSVVMANSERARKPSLIRFYYQIEWFLVRGVSSSWRGGPFRNNDDNDATTITYV